MPLPWVADPPSISTNGAAAVLGAITGTGSETVNISTGSASAGSINVDAINSVGAVTLESGTDSLVTSSIIAAGTVDLDGDAAITLGGLIQTTGGNDIEIATNGTLSMSGGLDTSNAGVDAAGSLNLNSSISNIVLSGNSIIRTNGTTDQAITIAETIDATSAGSQTLSIDSGTANLTISSAIGGATRIALTMEGNEILPMQTSKQLGFRYLLLVLELIDLSGVDIDANGGNVFLFGLHTFTQLYVNCSSGTPQPPQQVIPIPAP